MEAEFKRLISPVLFGLSLGLASLLVWYKFLSSLFPPEVYRPLHHWMYGLSLLLVGALKKSREYGRFSLSLGAILLADDFQDFLEIFSLLKIF